MDSLLDPGRFRPDRLPSPAFMLRDDDFVELLKSPDFDTRLQTLNRVMSFAKREPNWFSSFQKKGELFKNIDRILTDDRWEVQHQCVKFLLEAMPTFGTSLEYCICYVMPNLLPKLGSSKITVRKVTIQAIQAFLKTQPEAIGSVQKMLVNYLLTSPDRATKIEVLQEVPASMFNTQVANANWFTLLNGLTKWMSEADKETTEKIAFVGKKLEVFVGKENFERAFQELPANQQNDYTKNTKNFVVTVEESEQAHSDNLSIRGSLKIQSGERRNRFGIVPAFVASMMTDDTDANTRIAGLEQLKQIVEKMTAEEINRLVPHLHSYLIQLSHLLSDLNFKVVVLTLDVIRLTVNRLKGLMEAHLQQIVSLLSKHLGNQKAVIKQLIMMTCMDLFQNLPPKSVVGVLCIYLENRNSRMREEVVNIITSALMIISPSKINFVAVINVLVPLLIDPKRRVRLAAFEQLSVVAYLMNGKTDILMKAIREIETKHDVVGLQNAVMARLRRHLLPRIRYDGLLEYSTPPVTDSTFDVADGQMNSSDNLDLHWILHATGGETMDRPISPLSMIVSNGKPTKKKTIEKAPWEMDLQDDTNSIHSLTKLDRGKSESEIIMRKQQQDDSCAISNPNSSTSSWHAPVRRQNSREKVVEDRSVSAVINRLNGKSTDLDNSLEKVRTNGMYKKQELNNNTIVPVQKSSVTSLSKARSEGNLSEERENEPPINHDETPIKPAKNGQYSEEYATTPYSSVLNNKKSISHHNLNNVNANIHTPLKNTTSQPAKKSHNFLKSGTTNRVKPASTKPVERESSKTQISTVPKTIGGTVPMALKKMESEEWSDKVEGLNIIAELSSSNPKQVSDHMHEVVVSVLNECKNLRSSVSRVALTTIGILFQNMQSKMDSELDKTTAILMQKAGDVSNAFIREDASDALEKLVKHASAIKCYSSIIAAGARSKNNTIRTSCARFISDIVERQGSNWTLNNQELLSRLVPQFILFAGDQAPSVRQIGKQTFVFLSQDPSFDRQMKKSVSDAEYKAVRDILGNIEKKGGMESLDASSVSLSSSLNRSNSQRKAVPRKLPDHVQLDLDETRNDLSAAGWERRVGGLRRFEEMCNTAPKNVASDTKLIEAFIGRLSDINSKVSLEGMDTYISTLPNMAKQYSREAHLKAVLNQLVMALMSHLSSKSEEHKHLARTCLMETVKQIDSAALSSAIAAATKKANVKQKPYMLEIFTKLNNQLYSQKPKQVEVVALPILWDSIRQGINDPETKAALMDFANGLARLMGDRGLSDAASMELEPAKKKILDSILR